MHRVDSADTAVGSNTRILLEINVTPLIDVLMVLIIIFMLVFPASPRSVDTALPKPPAPSPRPPPSDFLLAIDDSASGPTYSFNGHPMTDLSALAQELRSTFETRPDRTIFVKASGTISYGKVVEAMDVARGAGVQRIGLISQKMLSNPQEAR